MDIVTTSGTLIHYGKSVVDNDTSIFDYVEVQNEAGDIVKLYNFVVGNDCLRAVKTGNVVSIVHCYSAERRSGHFPTNRGMSFVYAIYSARANRVFDDITFMQASYDSLKSARGRCNFFTWCFAAGMPISLLLGKASFALSLAWLIIPAIFQIFYGLPLRLRMATLTDQSNIAPHLAALQARIQRPGAKDAPATASVEEAATA